VIEFAVSFDPARQSAESGKARDPGAVRGMFDSIARRYDVANHVLSGGADLWWRNRAAKMVKAWSPTRVLDVATGSGDLALAIRRKVPHAEVTGVDFSPEMLAIAHRKGVAPTIVADALNLPFADESFDCVTVAFGLRNMADWSAALREIARVLSASGRLLVLDFSLPRDWLLPAYRFYLHRCLPTLASAVTGNRAAYDYLGATIEQFPSGHAMTQLIAANGFSRAEHVPLTAGIASIYTAQRRRFERPLD
jgi:demethylmenaquinone methyltransferase/2-methoxy-6-polyprenyl-1,4-benzoquinol methylase